MKACPVGLAGLVVAVREPGASFLHGIFDGGRRVHDACACAAARGQHRLDGILPGLPRRCAARSAEAAHAAASSSDEPPRKPWLARPVCFVFWVQYCFRCVSFAARSMVSVFCLWTHVQSCLWRRATVIRIATVMISYRVRCSDEYDTLAQDLIRNKYAAKQPSQDR